MMATDSDFIQALTLTLKLALVSVTILLLVGVPLAWKLVHMKGPWRSLLEVFVSLPLVLPPTVLGFYLLLALGSEGPLGRIWGAGIGGGSGLAFSFPGLVIGSVIFSLPFVVRPLQNSFAAVGREQLELAYTLGASNLDAFVSVVLPQSKYGIITAAALGLAHTLGEFGVALMLGGNIPGETRVLSIALYDKVEALRFDEAHIYSAAIVFLACLLLALVEVLKRKGAVPWKN